MQFYEKLDFLMKISDTTNSALSMNVNLDASHISRLRRGMRGALKDVNSIRLMAEYFSRKCSEDYQLRALADALNLRQCPIDDKLLTELIVQWLIYGKQDETKKGETFFAGFSKLSAEQNLLADHNHNQRSSFMDSLQEEPAIYYGLQGKRQAVISFLSEVVAQKKPRTLLLYSDEATDWMTADRQFAAEWARLMIQTLSNGNKIKIIHTVSRDLDEMLNAVRQWMPLYMSGLIEPYYYPKKRDGIFKKTLFIAPEVSTVVSTSIGNMHEQAANLLFRDSKAIGTFEEEFNQYLNLCKPLMYVFTSKEEAAYLDVLLGFENGNSDSIMKSESLSLLTMPENVSFTITSRMGSRGSILLENQKFRTKFFEKNLKTNSFTEIIKVFDVELAVGGRIRPAYSIMMNGGSMYYTTDEYIQHLEHILYLLQTYENFHVRLTEEAGENPYMLYAREDIGTIVAKTSAPPVTLAVNESNLTAAFWDFLQHTIGETTNQRQKHEQRKLVEYISRLKQARQRTDGGD